MAKRLMLFLAVVLLVLLTAGMVWSAKQNPDLLKPDRPVRGDESFDYLITKASTVFPNAFCGETTILSPYDTCIGCTWYDYQHNSRIPRMCANDYQTITAGGHGHHYSFMYMDSYGTGSKRYISVTYYDADFGWETLPAPVITSQGHKAGYCGMNIFMDSRSVPYYHTTEAVFPATHDLGTVISVEPNLPGKLEFKNGKYWYDIPDSVNSTFRGMWPAADVDGDDQIHIVMNEGDTSPGPAWMGYVRCHEGGPDTIICQSPGLSAYTIKKETAYWNPLNRCTAFDTAGVIGANLTCSRVSDKVAICYAALAETETDSSLYQVSNDAFYIESPNGGDNWFTYPDSMQFRRNCSKYKVTDKMRVYGEVTAVYDFNDSLHVYWYTHYYDQVANEIDINDIALWHFSENTIRFCDGESVYANKIAAANWPSTGAVAGAWNRLIAKITSGVGIKDGDNKNYLYITWTQFDTAKWNDAGNQTQGDLYTTVSTDAGMTWMIPVNITNSTVDSCAAGLCASDHWGSMAERVDDYLHLQWVYDLDVGGVVQDEGEPTNNPVLVYDFPKSSIPLENKARIGWTPSDFLVPYVHCPTNGNTTVKLTIENIGTATLSSISLSESATWLSIGTYPTSIVAGGCPANVTLTITGQGAEEFYVDSIHVTSNDQAGNNDFYIRFHVVMSDVYVSEEDTTMSNPTMYVGFANVGNVGDQTDTTGYYLHQDANEPTFLYDGSVLMAFTAPNGDSLVSRWIFNEHYFLPERDAIVTDMTGIKTKIVDAEFNPTTPQAPLPWHHRWWYWTLRTKDYIFYSGAATDKKEQYVTLRYIKLYYNPPPPWWPDITPPTSITTTYVGMGLDIDAPSDSGSWNYPGSDESRRMAYLRGYGGVNENYRMGIAQRDTCYWTIGATGPVYCCWPDPGTIVKDIPFAMHVLRNDSVVYPHNGYDDPDLFKWMSLPGDSIQPDTLGDTPPEDYNIVTTGRVIPAGSFPPADTYEVAYALVVSDEFEIDKMNRTVDMIQCGNANRDISVTIADVVYIISFLFKSGAEPWVYACDVNSSGDVTIADCVYLVNYLFKSGAPPQCSKDWK